jgi:peptide deformylase
MTAKMRLKIVQVGEQVLRERARPLSPEEIRSESIQLLIEFMRETMQDAPGVGLAAPQVGMSIQLAVIEDREEYHRNVTPEQMKERERKPVPFHVIINPNITLLDRDGEAEFFEGCLSVAGYTAIVPRARTVRVDCLDHKGNAKTINASGWYARILQHEIDHLGGTIYTDRMHPRSLMTVENVQRYWKDKSIQDMRAALKLST